MDLRFTADQERFRAEARAWLELITALYYSAHAGQAASLPVADTHPFHAGWR